MLWGREWQVCILWGRKEGQRQVRHEVVAGPWEECQEYGLFVKSEREAQEGWVQGRGWPGPRGESSPYSSPAGRHCQGHGHHVPSQMLRPRSVALKTSPALWHCSTGHSRSSGSLLCQCRRICVWRVSGRKPMGKKGTEFAFWGPLGIARLHTLTAYFHFPLMSGKITRALQLTCLPARA